MLYKMAERSSNRLLSLIIQNVNINSKVATVLESKYILTSMQ